MLANIKLVSGEDIVGMTTLHQDDTHKVLCLLIENPVIMIATESKKTKKPVWSVIPWMPLIQDELHIIDMDKVISYCCITSPTIQTVYNRYLLQKEKDEKGIPDSVQVEAKNNCTMKVSEFRNYLINNYNSL